MFELLRKKGMLITRFLDRRTSQVAWSGWHTTMEGVKAELSCVGPPKEREKEQGLEMVCNEQHGHSLVLRPHPITSACPPLRTPKPMSVPAISDPLHHNPTHSALHPSWTPSHH